MNYRELLKKYIAHVSSCESIDFISETDRKRSKRDDDVVFTEDEWLELQILSEEPAVKPVNSRK